MVHESVRRDYDEHFRGRLLGENNFIIGRGRDFELSSEKLGFSSLHKAEPYELAAVQSCGSYQRSVPQF
jgi:hypothetical protein